VTRFDPYGDLSLAVRLALGALLLVAAVATVGAFAVDPESAAPSPVAYDDVVELGLSSETDALMAGSATIPRTQVFYSQLQYVVGYNGVESFAATFDDGRTERQFGYPIVAYVETFDDARPGTTESGLFAAEVAGEWTPAPRAVYVVGSDARSPAGETVVPFRERDAAEAFVADHGGRVMEWESVRTQSFDADSAATVREMAPDRWAAADERIAAAERRTDRPVSVVVGEDAPTIEAALAAAPANTTIVVPSGTYEEELMINESVTIAGENARISGDGNGSVITVRAPDVAITGVAVDGSGNMTRDPDAAREEQERDAEGETWDTNIQLGYGHGDAGIRAIGAPGLFVDEVTVDAHASGLLLRDGSHAVVRDLRVDGTEDWQAGFMGIAGMQSRVTVTDSAFSGGRDGIYLHRADGSVVRNSSFADNRYGVHLMYTGDTLIADNAFRNELFGGITVMTRPSGNAIVGNDVRNSSAGIQASGTRAYLGYNTLVGNELGFATSSRGSLYERNVAVNNELGARATTVVPSSRVVETTSSATRTTRPPGQARSGSGQTATVGTTGRGRTSGYTSPASARTDRPHPSTGRCTVTSPWSPCASRPRPPSWTASVERFPARARGVSSTRHRQRTRTPPTGWRRRSTQTRARSTPTGAADSTTRVTAEELMTRTTTETPTR